MPRHTLRFSAYTCIALSLAVSTTLSEVTSWRNGGNGLYPDARPSLNWNAPDHVVWKIDTPSWGNACPLLVGDRLIFTAEPTQLVCVDSRTGELLWETTNNYEDVADLSPSESKRIAKAKELQATLQARLQPLQTTEYKLTRRFQRDKGNAELKAQLRAVRQKITAIEAEIDPILERFEKPKTHDINGYASYTPCSDGQYIYSCNGLGIVTKHDLEGNRIWGKTLEKPDHNWGGSVSPQLVDGKLIVRFSDYLALDPQTGEELWRVPNPHTFGAPAAFQVENKWYLYTCRGELIRVADGQKLPSQDWTIEQKTFAFFNTPFVSGNRLYAVHGAAGIQGDVYCMEAPNTIEELESKGLKQIWYTEISKERYYASPIVHDGLMYVFSMGQVFQVLDAKSGQLIYSKKIPGRMERTFPGLLLVNGLIYAGEENGTAFFIKPGRQFEEIARFNLGECRSTPIFKDDITYLRTRESVLAIKEP